MSLSEWIGSEVESSRVQNIELEAWTIGSHAEFRRVNLKPSDLKASRVQPSELKAICKPCRVQPNLKTKPTEFKAMLGPADRIASQAEYRKEKDVLCITSQGS